MKKLGLLLFVLLLFGSPAFAQNAKPLICGPITATDLAIACPGTTVFCPSNPMPVRRARLLNFHLDGAGGNFGAGMQAGAVGASCNFLTCPIDGPLDVAAQNLTNENQISVTATCDTVVDSTATLSQLSAIGTGVPFYLHTGGY